MDSVTYEFPRRREIDVNGKTFAVRMSEDEILDQMIYFSTEYRDVDSLEDRNEKHHQFYNFCDRMLGKGALTKIVGNHPLSIDEKASLIMAIAKTACAAYRRKLDGYDE
ncbi:MAG: hypothetical protein VB104_07515 [Candidatus Limiplasma sp.]|nr:hypothetical protein [Candidatus Limiplasma sp.]